MKNTSKVTPLAFGETNQQMHKQRAVIKFAVLALVLVLCIGGHYFFRHVAYPNLALPRSFGFIKDMFDPLVVIFIYWGGWIFGVTLLVSRCLTTSFYGQFYLYVSASIAMGVVQTIVGFDSYSVPRFLRGIATYFAIFGVVYLILFCALYILRGVGKCHQ